jgi:hypothetical protein
VVSPVDVVNLALDAVNARAQVSSIFPSDGSTAADIAARQYQIRFDQLGRSAHWNTLRRQATSLTVLKAMQGTPENPNGTLPQPPQPWLYEYQLPSDLLKARYIPPLVPIASTSPPIMSQVSALPPMLFRDAMIPYVLDVDTDQNGNEIKVMLTNQPQAQLVYTARVTNCDLWDSGFTTGFVATLAVFMCRPVSGNAELAKEQLAVAKAVIDQARVSDGNEGRTTTDHMPDWIQVRGAGWYTSGGAQLWAPWDTMAFPSGPPY